MVLIALGCVLSSINFKAAPNPDACAVPSKTQSEVESIDVDTYIVAKRSIVEHSMIRWDSRACGKFTGSGKGPCCNALAEWVFVECCLLSV